MIQIKFGEIAEFRNGLNFAKESQGKGCLLIGIPDFKDRFIPHYETLTEINPSGITKAEDFLKKNDILFVRSNGNKDLVGRSLFIDKNIKALYSGFCIRARLTSDLISPIFLAYFTRTNRFKSLISSSGGTSIQNLNQGILANVKIPLFPKKEQQQIASVLSSLDSKIELNNKINAELEAMAKLIYDYWFVQFEFPIEAALAAKMGDSSLAGKPYKSSGGPMVYNQDLKREIPEGWEVDSLGNYAVVKKGTLVTEKTADTSGKIKVVSAGLDYSYFHSKSNYEANTITISASGASAGYINFWREPIFACDCTTVRGESDSVTLLVLGFLKMRQAYIYQQARGSAQPHVYPKDIEGLKIAIPPKSLIEDFGAIVVPGNQTITINLKQNQELSSLRDWLLPMLMNGQVTIKEAEEQLSMAAEERGDYGK
ncbi:hypothetical protein AWW67_16205 [Roseivirga seohaensis]|uniref:Type I restriction modification DNA specificity domain-containing protein n=1 Tax=Roseivirga seohaensis TaxID=1914963 RepID=A0A150Y2L2_9BACT|nr:restriction endonuclease subunit S [Roseivirga seohaensis]KYG85253.1 hypothetical protein AWW67_16205 [Roseivirga seohaensis]